MDRYEGLAVAAGWLQCGRPGGSRERCGAGRGSSFDGLRLTKQDPSESHYNENQEGDQQTGQASDERAIPYEPTNDAACDVGDQQKCNNG